MRRIVIEPGDVLRFWFGDLGTDARDEAAADRRQTELWWGKDPANDSLVAARFGDLLARVDAGGLDGWENDPAGHLALTLVLDQFPRMIHRGTPRAFAWDERAAALCLAGLERRLDAALRPLERSFFYLPLEHSERLEDQVRSVACFERLAREAPDGLADRLGRALDFARRHHVVIEKFGRFPHRNRILGRPSTQAEIDFLRLPGSSF